MPTICSPACSPVIGRALVYEPGLAVSNVTSVLPPLASTPTAGSARAGGAVARKAPATSSARRRDMARTLTARRTESDLQAGVLEIQLALEPVHDVVGDVAAVAQADDLAPLRLQPLAHERLVGGRAVLDPFVVVGEPGAGGEPALAVAVHAAHPLDRFVARPLLALELLDPGERRLGRHQPPRELLALLAAVVVHAQDGDHPRQREA